MPRLRSLLIPANFFRVILLIVCIQAVGHLRDEKPPWKSAWGRHRAEGVDPSFREHLATGLWAGAVARLGFGATLLVLSLAWGRQGSSPAAKGQSGDVIAPSHRPLGAALSAPTSPSPLLYYSLLGALLAGALAMRLPRLTHSFWGDEEDSMATYIHGMYKPTKKKDRQGAVYFEPPLWAQTFYSARHGPNNHVLFSVTSRLSLEAWRKLTKHKNTEFTEWVARLPSLVAGLASLAGLALLLRRWGVPWLGLLAALFMAIHPWHVRYSVEARGYALALAFYPFLLIALTNALDFGRWRSWLAYGLFQFLIMYSWAGSAYLLVMLNLVVAVMALRSQQRWPQLVRWTTVNLAAAGAFISLYAPHVPQIIEAKKRLLWLKGLPMDAAWFHNLLAEPFSGIPYHKGDVTNPGEISWQGLWSESPALTSAGFSLVLLAFLAGLPRLWRHHRGQACLIFSAFVAAIVCTLHFKFGIGDELRSWYLIFILPALSITVAFGLQGITSGLLLLWRKPLGSKWQAAHATAALALIAVIAASWWTMNRSLMLVPFEDYRGVMAASRDQHEKFAVKAKSNVLMCWLWRYAPMYDPRGEIHIHTGEAMRSSMAEMKASNGELYVVLGFRSLARSLNAEVLAMLENPDLFEKVAHFPSRHSIQMMEVYRMRKEDK